MSSLALKRGCNRFFGAKKSVMGGKAYGKIFQLRKKTESHNALSDAEKCDIGPENACNWIVFTDFQLVYRGPTPYIIEAGATERFFDLNMILFCGRVKKTQQSDINRAKEWIL